MPVFGRLIDIETTRAGTVWKNGRSREREMFLKYRNLWRYGYILGIVITIVGFISPWWCTGHWTFTCTNSIGLSWYSTFGFGSFEIVGFELTIGTLIIIPLTILVWLRVFGK